MNLENLERAFLFSLSLFSGIEAGRWAFFVLCYEPILLMGPVNISLIARRRNQVDKKSLSKKK